MKIINEEALTSSELEKREEIIKKLKPSRKSFIHRYGKDAEKIMYAVATKQAKNMNKNKIQELVKLSLSKKLNEEDIEVGADKYEYEKSNQEAINQLDDLEQKLKNHDWYYSFSDSNQEYLKGQKQIKDINNLIKSLKEKGYNEEVKELYNKYKPSKFPELTESEINSKEYISSRKNPTDIISMDVPLFLRILEYAKEDAKTDMDLHDVTEKATTLSSTKNILTMSDYNNIVGGELGEKKLTAAEKRKKEDIVKGMKKSFKGDEGAMYAIATDKAKKLAESEKKGLMVFGRTPLDNNAIKDMVNDGDFYAEWNPAEGYWFFPEVEEEYDELEYYLEQEFNKRNINARFEGIFNEGLSKGYWAKKIPGGKMDESFKQLTSKLKKQGKSEKAATAIAGAVASYKAKGGGSGPTSKQKTKMAEIVLSKLKGK